MEHSAGAQCEEPMETGTETSGEVTEVEMETESETSELERSNVSSSSF